MFTLYFFRPMVSTTKTYLVLHWGQKRQQTEQDKVNITAHFTATCTLYAVSNSTVWITIRIAHFSFVIFQNVEHWHRVLGQYINIWQTELFKFLRKSFMSNKIYSLHFTKHKTFSYSFDAAVVTGEKQDENKNIK